VSAARVNHRAGKGRDDSEGWELQVAGCPCAIQAVEDEWVVVFASSIARSPDLAKAIERARGNRLLDVYKTLGSSLGRKTERREISSWFASAAATLLTAAIALARHWSPPLP
jgi:hypothetical protein